MGLRPLLRPPMNRIVSRGTVHAGRGLGGPYRVNLGKDASSLEAKEKKS